MDRDVEQLMDGPIGRPTQEDFEETLATARPDPATCVHVWEREPLPVAVSRPGSKVGTVHDAFPCEKCGSLVVMNDREG